ncbi:hypothetical protein CMO83_05270 [Candidatus Woesearchaeota archaeon]|nr:hypothetical protein [Candidatus Woesearchaeota archaeon]|tara:strand:- start:40902 stop:41600 length:699 start_codon:yes stop_codon:yes gene_type:complete
MDKHFVDAEKLSHELEQSSDLISIGTLCLIGGEPLLHPDLADVVEACANSGISKHVRVVTNGLPVSRITGDVWKNVDEVYVSLYGQAKLSEEKIQLFREIAEENQIALRVASYPQFRETFSQNPSADEALTERVFKACEVAHNWKCYTLDEGILYLCPQSLFIPRVQPEVKTEGVSLLDPKTTPQQIRDFLSRDTPLDACKHCLGSAGSLFSHTLTTIEKIGFNCPHHSTAI